MAARHPLQGGGGRLLLRRGRGFQAGSERARGGLRAGAEALALLVAREGGTIGALWEAALAAGWKSADEPGQWVKVVRLSATGTQRRVVGAGGGGGTLRPRESAASVVATTDPERLPDRSTWYLTTNLPAPGSERETESDLAPASVAEVVRLYGLRMWVEQSYKQVKHALGWSDYQVRSDIAIRRHWQLVCLRVLVLLVGIRALADRGAGRTRRTEDPTRPNRREGGKRRARCVLAGGVEGGEGVAGAVGDAVAILEGVLRAAPADGAKSAA